MPPPQRHNVPAVAPTFHLQMRLLTSQSTVGPWAGHVFRVQVGRPAAPDPRHRAAPRPRPTESVYGVVTAGGMVDALLPADWEDATLDIGDALGSGSAANPAPSFGAARLSIPLARVEPQEEEERRPGDGPPSLFDRAAARLRRAARIGVRLINLGYLAVEVASAEDGVAAAHLVGRAVRSYVFRQLHRASPVRVDLFPQLVRVLATGDDVIQDEDFLAALDEHHHAVHDLLEHVP